MHKIKISCSENETQIKYKLKAYLLSASVKQSKGFYFQNYSQTHFNELKNTLKRIKRLKVH